MKLLVATRSRGKQREFAGLLSGLAVEVVFPDDLGLAESPLEEALEEGSTFAENATAKARWFAALSGFCALADDSGLEVDALGGAPGVHSKRYAGMTGSDLTVSATNNAALLRALTGVPAGRRTARYRCTLVLARPVGAPWSWPLPAEGDVLTVDGTTEGRILDAPHGDGGFGYDPLFFSDDLRRAFGEVSAEEKHAVSHRGRAVQALVNAMTRCGPSRDR